MIFIPTDIVTNKFYTEKQIKHLAKNDIMIAAQVTAGVFFDFWNCATGIGGEYTFHKIPPDKMQKKSKHAAMENTIYLHYNYIKTR